MYIIVWFDIQFHYNVKIPPKYKTIPYNKVRKEKKKLQLRNEVSWCRLKGVTKRAEERQEKEIAVNSVDTKRPWRSRRARGVVEVYQGPIRKRITDPSLLFPRFLRFTSCKKETRALSMKEPVGWHWPPLSVAPLLPRFHNTRIRDLFDTGPIGTIEGETIDREFISSFQRPTYSAVIKAEILIV